MNTHIARYVESIRSAVEASASEERLWVQEVSSAATTVAEELKQPGQGWTLERWAIGAVGSEEPATDGALHTDDCLEVLAALTRESQVALVSELEQARSEEGKVELPCRVMAYYESVGMRPRST